MIGNLVVGKAKIVGCCSAKLSQVLLPCILYPGRGKKIT